MSEAPLWADLGARHRSGDFASSHRGAAAAADRPDPLRRGGIYLLGWMATTLLALVALLTLGHGLVLDMTHGSQPQAGLN